MTIVLNIKPEAEEELSRRAAAHGIALDVYAASLLEDAAAHASNESKALSHTQLDKMLHELAQFSYKVPLLTDEAFSRESLYRDRD